MYQLHHIFVCAAAGGPEAQALLDAGLVEGTPNTHPGQGTANRRFFFQQGFLELLWVHDELEAQSEIAGPTRLQDRWAGRGNTTNPFGLCFASAQGKASALPFASREYRPPYLTEGRSFLFATGQPLSEPEVFALGWPQEKESPKTEPTRHPLGLIEMRSVSIGMPDPTGISATLTAARNAGLVKIHHSTAPGLVIEFVSDEELELSVPELGIRIVGQPGRHP